MNLFSHPLSTSPGTNLRSIHASWRLVGCHWIIPKRLPAHILLHHDHYTILWLVRVAPLIICGFWITYIDLLDHHLNTCNSVELPPIQDYQWAGIA
jgi:hypothetical protein